MSSHPLDRAHMRLALIDQRDTQIARLQEQRKVVQQEIAALEELKRQRAELLDLKQGALQFEADLITKALTDSDGHITPAAVRLGVDYQYLAYLLDNRHKAIAHLRTPIRRRGQRT